MSHYDQFSGDSRSYEGTWEKLSQVAVKGAESDSRERQPHPKCLKGTRVDLLNHIHGLLDTQGKSRLIWLHGTAGVGKSAVAFTVAETMRGLKVAERANNEKRLAGTFFFSRKHTKRSTTGHFFATLAYQLARNFPSVREEVNTAIREHPALLDPDTSLREQMEALFLRPLRKLRFRLRECQPSMFVVDALDECTSATELADLISLLAEVLHEPDLPVIHILLTSRSEEHIRKAMQTEDVRPLVCEIPVKTSGEGVSTIISLDGADVDSDICTFLEHSFRELGSRHPDFPQPPMDQLAQLASRAGRRFIVASTMMKFIDDGDNDPRDRLQLMLELTSELLPGTEVYKLYDRILSTCADPKRAYQHLSVVATLADPLPISQISKILGPGLGRDVETALVQLRSIMDIPTHDSLPVNIYHSSVRDYVSDPSNCSLPQVQYIISPHTVLAHSSLRLMMQDSPECATLLEALSELKIHSQAMQPQDPQSLNHSLSFIVQPLEPIQILTGLLWLRGDRGSDLQPWLETLDGHAWLQTRGGTDWLQTEGGKDWLQTQRGGHWLETLGAKDWLQTQGGRTWLQTWGGDTWLCTESGREWLATQGNQAWLETSMMLHSWGGQEQQTQSVQVSLVPPWSSPRLHDMWSLSQRDWLLSAQECLLTPTGQELPETSNWRERLYELLDTPSGQEWLETPSGQEWLETPSGQEWLETPSGQEWLRNRSGQQWLKTSSGKEWLQTPGGLDTPSGQQWLQTSSGQQWLQTSNGQQWLQIQSGRNWLRTQSGLDWLQTPHGQAWQATPGASVWVTMEQFSNTSEAISEYVIIPDLHLLPAFQAIQQFKSLPDFLMFPVFLALMHQNHSTSACLQRHSPLDMEIIESTSLLFPFPTFPSSGRQGDSNSASLQGCFPPDMEIIHAMRAFDNFASEARERTRSASDALKYACQNWIVHLSRAANPWDESLNRTLKLFWNRHLLSWLERQWCLKDLRSCLTILSEGEKLVKDHFIQASGSSQSRI